MLLQIPAQHRKDDLHGVDVVLVEETAQAMSAGKLTALGEDLTANRCSIPGFIRISHFGLPQKGALSLRV